MRASKEFIEKPKEKAAFWILIIEKQIMITKI